jgi:hypothetical protein
MATIARPRPRTRIDNLRDTPEEREKHQLETLEEWRPIREKSNTK